MASAGITFSATEDGLVSSASIATDGSGNASATFTMGTKASTVTVTADGYGASGSTTTFDAPVETWHWDHYEKLLLASFEVTGSTVGVPSGETRPVNVHVDSRTWSVLVSDLDPLKTKIGSESTSPAIGAEVTLSLVSGDGSIAAADSPSKTGETGDAVAIFTMGADQSVLRADVTYDTTNTTYATATFAPVGTSSATAQADVMDGENVVGSTTMDVTADVPGWSRLRIETTISTTLSTADAATTLLEGRNKWVTAQVMFDSWEIWGDGTGNIDPRNHASGAAGGAAGGAQVSFSMDGGNGTISSAATSTDADGCATVLFTMGSDAASRVRADVSYSTATSAGSLDFTLDTWVAVGPGSAISMVLSADASTVTADVIFKTWTVYTDGTAYENRNTSYGPAGNAEVTFWAGGDASVPVDPTTLADIVNTGLNGSAGTSYSCTANSRGTITARVTFSEKSDSATISVNGEIVGGGGNPGGGDPGSGGGDPGSSGGDPGSSGGDSGSSGGNSGSGGGDSGGDGDAAQGQPPEDYPPAVGITARAPGKVSDNTAWVGNPAIMRPNDDNDDGVVAAPGAPPHHDNEDTDIDPKDDDITKVYIGIDRGKGRNSAISGTVIVTLPASGFKIYNSPAGGTVLSGSYTLDLENPSGPLAPLITTGGICLYVETAPGTLQSGDITITSELALDNGFTANPNSNLTLLPVEFKLRQNSDVFKGWDSTASPRWTSVGVGRTNSLVKLVLPAGEDYSNYTLRVWPGDSSYVSISNNEITGPETMFSITGLQATVQAGASVVLCDKRHSNPFNFGAILDFHVHVLPERTVHVGIYYASADKPNPDHPEVVIAASALQAGRPTPAQILQKLNDAYNAQANITFVLDDTAVLDDCYEAFQPNGDIYHSSNAGVTDAWRGVFSRAWDRNQDPKLHRFFVAKHPVHMARDTVGDGYHAEFAAGFTPAGETFSFVIGSLQNNDILVYAHEMGHALNIPVLHPANDYHDPGPWPSEFSSDGTPYSDQRGLMKGGFSGMGGYLTSWMRRQDWREANDKAKSRYEH